MKCGVKCGVSGGEVGRERQRRRRGVVEQRRGGGEERGSVCVVTGASPPLKRGFWLKTVSFPKSTGLGSAEERKENKVEPRGEQGSTENLTESTTEGDNSRTQSRVMSTACLHGPPRRQATPPVCCQRWPSDGPAHTQFFTPKPLLGGRVSARQPQAHLSAAGRESSVPWWDAAIIPLICFIKRDR